MSPPILNHQKLTEMKNHLELIAIALISLCNVNPDSLSLDPTQPLTLEQLEAFAQTLTNLSKQQQELIRRAVNLLENMTEQQQPYQQSTLLGDYLDKFRNHCNRLQIETKQLEHLAIKLLIDLLFYSSSDGYNRLWSVLIEEYP